jgi:flagellar basal-body rod modification protein FlgD
MTQSTSGVSSAGQSVPSDTSVTNPASMMGENDFLKLLVAQLQYQDPMNPTDNNQFMQQQAQFATVEGINNLQKTMTAMQAQQQVGLIGKQVSYPNSDGSIATGVVSAVNTASNGTVTVTVNGQSVAPSAITTVSADPDGASETEVLSQLLQLLESGAAGGAGDGTTDGTSDATDGTGA